jgi:hypothetical protein
MDVKAQDITFQEALIELEREWFKLNSKQLSLEERNNKSNDNQSGNENKHEHKIVKKRQLVSHMNDGWEYVREINRDEYLVRK